MQTTKEATSSSPMHEYLKAKIQIGNVQGPTSYQLNQTVFHHDDIPEVKRHRKNEVKQWMKSRILSADIPPWNQSSKFEKPVIVRRQAENFVADRSLPYQYNYRSETLEYLNLIEPIDAPDKFHVSRQLETRAREITATRSSSRIQRGQFNRTGEMPIHPKLENSGPWNLSTEIQLPEKEKRLVTMTNTSKEWSKKVNPKLTKDKYIDPVAYVTKLQETIREQKRDGTFSTAKHVFIPPLPPVNRRALVNQFAIETKDRVVHNYHSGVFETSRVDGRYNNICYIKNYYTHHYYWVTNQSIHNDCL
jgi:hypothetical protein